MRIKKSEIQENNERATKIAKQDVEALQKNLEPVSQSIQPDIEKITGNPETADIISKKIAASAIDKAYSEDSMNEVGPEKVHTSKFDRCVADVKEIEGVDNEEPMNDLPFESVRPKMTKDELIESVKRNTSKKRKVIKTISVKNLRNE